MAKITDYPKVQELLDTNVFILDGDNGTKGILTRDLAKALLASLTTKEIMSNIAVSDLDGISSVSAADSLLIGTADGNKKIAMSDAVYAILDASISNTTRRKLWRGKNLGSVVTAEQYAEIKAGTFRGMFLGDYWNIGGKYWRIVDFDYWLITGDNTCQIRHLVIMPDKPLYNAKMNDSNTTEGGYVGSKMYTNNLAEAKTIINGAFGEEHILNHRELLVNAVSNGAPSGGGWFDSTVDLPNEIMIYGSYIITPANDGVNIPHRYTIDKTQLAAFSAHPVNIVSSQEAFWLRDVVSASPFAYVSSTGGSLAHYASGVVGVRPVFGLIG